MYIGEIVDRKINFIYKHDIKTEFKSFLSFAILYLLVILFFGYGLGFKSFSLALDSYALVLVLMAVLQFVQYLYTSRKLNNNGENLNTLEIKFGEVYYRGELAKLKYTQFPIFKKNVITVTSYGKHCYFRIRITPSMVSLKDWQELVNKCT
ncbi:hypothetical protein M634_10740 [Vibrio parahaemolyticus O1:Kuk str. FDA_R31]|nr:hypothetical protein M634_10740 [Vibrio parahaemolyticus O1:Kuk str. FDA_R31]EGR1689864.1 hypothetical protein [Vibrio parahaemolyticus]ODW64496.1 hypothetical protein BBL89_15435 [Vibrio parahaemolyticus]ODW71506.1 hypothetical protein BBL90_06510 [Vibrio parahaemolyticus]ODY47175.1 hypothetical protein BBM25_19550 [Vibrio parahaemolyticus]